MDVLFFIVAKAGGFLLRPETLLVLLLAAGPLAVWLGRPRLGQRMSMVGLVAVLVIAFTPIAQVLYRPLELRFPATPELATPPVGILILGGGEEFGPAGTPPQLNPAGERYTEAIALAHRYPDAFVMFTGGRATIRLGDGRNARHAATVFRRSGIEAERVALETTSRNTVENAEKGLPLRPPGTEKGPWLFVTSAWHMPRALGTFCAAGWEGLVPWPTDFRHHQGGFRLRFADNLLALNLVAKEWLGLVGYRATGRTDELMPSGCPPTE
ncbi:MAG: YdcF family protein [Pseudomonadota bacterium]